MSDWRRKRQIRAGLYASTNPQLVKSRGEACSFFLRLGISFVKEEGMIVSFVNQ